jgi:hypothetical protein
MRVLEEVVSIDALKPRIERFNTIEEGLAERREYQNEITKLGRFVQTSGFSPGRDFMRVASIPSSVWSAVLEVFPDAGTNKELFYALLSGPLRDYDLRARPTLT